MQYVEPATVLNGQCVEGEDVMAAIKSIVQGFLSRLPYQSPRTPPNADLRREVTAEIVSWGIDLGQAYIDALTDASCIIAECAYGHTSYKHQLLVGLYTAQLIYVDDQGKQNVEAVAQFVQRYAQGERQSNTALEHIASLLGTVHEYYARISADAIVASTLDATTGMYTELVTQGNPVSPHATKYPYYLRLRAGIAPAYAHFNFMKSWGDVAGTYYLQLVPELELITVGINDILSFYKESLAGETDNYIHMRANAEQTRPIMVLHQLVEEVLDSIRKIERLASAQPGLTEVCSAFVVGYIEFHFNARRYGLQDLELEF